MTTVEFELNLLRIQRKVFIWSCILNVSNKCSGHLVKAQSEPATRRKLDQVTQRELIPGIDVTFTRPSEMPAFYPACPLQQWEQCYTHVYWHWCDLPLWGHFMNLMYYLQSLKHEVENSSPKDRKRIVNTSQCTAPSHFYSRFSANTP